MQCTVASYGKITKEAVLKVCDEPHPDVMNKMFEYCVEGQVLQAFETLDEFYKLGHSVDDIMGALFKTAKIVDLPEVLRMEFIMVV
jgi:replication factor C subunit 2/4